MSTEKYQKLLASLHKQTSEGRLNWQSLPDNEYIVSFSNYSLGLSHSYNSESGNLITMTIYDKNGRVVDVVSDEDFDNLSFQELGFGGSYKFMESLYDLARRKANGIDEALDFIINELGE